MTTPVLGLLTRFCCIQARDCEQGGGDRGGPRLRQQEGQDPGTAARTGIVCPLLRTNLVLFLLISFLSLATFMSIFLGYPTFLPFFLSYINYISLSLFPSLKLAFFSLFLSLSLYLSHTTSLSMYNLEFLCFPNQCV